MLTGGCGISLNCLMITFHDHLHFTVSELLLNSMSMVKSRLLSRSTLSSTVIGVVPQEPTDDNRVNMMPLNVCYMHRMQA